MDKYKVVIVDDDDLSIDNLSFELTKDVRFCLKGIARNGKQGRKVITKVQPDLLFLDVEMPDTSGMELLREIRDAIAWNMRVVFYTAYDKYMIEAIRESAFDYLLKPFDQQDLKNILTRFIKQAESGKKRLSPISTFQPIEIPFIVYTPTNDMRVLRPMEVVFFRYCSERKQWEAILSDQPPLMLRRGTIAAQITGYSLCFIQIHQSYIVNINYLMIIKGNKCLLYPPFEKVTELVISQKYKKELQDKFSL